MKHKITFKGRNSSGFVSYGGVKFPCGEAVTVSTGDEPGEISQAWLARLENHPEFEVAKPTAAKAAAEKKD